MSGSSHNWVMFLGRFHPMLVHLPIGGLILLGVLELLAKFSLFKDAARSNRLILGLTTEMNGPAFPNHAFNVSAKHAGHLVKLL
jgi:hypothetical protein